MTERQIQAEQEPVALTHLERARPEVPMTVDATPMKGARSRRRPAAGRFTIVENVSASGAVSIPHPDKSRGGSDDITLQPKGRPGDRVALLPDEAEWWRRSMDLVRMVNEGYVRIYESDSVPPERPRVPPELRLDRPDDSNLAHQIVFGPDNIALDILRMEPRREREAGRPLDVPFMKTRFRPILALARWLEEHLDAPRQGRLDMIEARIAEIDRIP